MEIRSTPTPAPLNPTAELDRLGDEIAELSAHLDAATARLLDLIREFDARGAAAREALYQRARAAAAAACLPVDPLLTPFRQVDPALEPPTMEQQQADALFLLAETALHHELHPGAPGERYQVVVHVDAPALADPGQPGQSVLEDGTHVSAETSRRLACDASRVVMRHDEDGRVTEICARTRTIPPALRRALQHRDQGCRFPGCGSRFTQGHHLHHWAQGGPTTLSNLALLCRRHHRAVHEEGYQVGRQPDGTLRFHRPDGGLLPAVPPPAPVPADPVPALQASHLAQGLRLHARTAAPAGSGNPWTWAGRSTSCILSPPCGRRSVSSSGGSCARSMPSGHADAPDCRRE